jgi:hypothetical protein
MMTIGHRVLIVFLFMAAIGLSSAAALHLVVSEKVGNKAAVIWCIVISSAWAAWYVAVTQ